MKKILCPVDYSATADHALAAAAKLAQKCEARLDLFNVQSLLTLKPSEILMGPSIRVAGTAGRLDDLASEIGRVYKISCYGNAQASSRSLPYVISEAGDGYDLLVMGTNGADDVYDAVFGTNSYQVARQSSVPVLLLPKDYQYQGFSKIVFAVDYFHDLKSPPEQLIKWASFLDAHITLVQIMTEKYRHDQEEKLLEAEHIMEDAVDKTHFNFKTIYADTPIDGIIDYVNANECDALALCFRHHSFIEKLFHKDVVKNLCALAPCPLFIFHF